MGNVIFQYAFHITLKRHYHWRTQMIPR